MALEFSGGYALSPHAVEFYGWDGEQMITCSIPVAFLSRWLGVALSNEAEIRDAYVKHRIDLHRVTAELYDANDGEANGRLWLRRRDVSRIADAAPGPGKSAGRRARARERLHRRRSA